MLICWEFNYKIRRSYLTLHIIVSCGGFTYDVNTAAQSTSTSHCATRCRYNKWAKNTHTQNDNNIRNNKMSRKKSSVHRRICCIYSRAHVPFDSHVEKGTQYNLRAPSSSAIAGEPHISQCFWDFVFLFVLFLFFLLLFLLFFVFFMFSYFSFLRDH